MGIYLFTKYVFWVLKKNIFENEFIDDEKEDNLREMGKKKEINIDEKASSILRNIQGISAIEESTNNDAIEKMTNNEKKTVFKGINIDKDLYYILIDYAKENKLTFTTIVNESLEIYRRLHDIRKE